MHPTVTFPLPLVPHCWHIPASKYFSISPATWCCLHVVDLWCWTAVANLPLWPKPWDNPWEPPIWVCHRNKPFNRSLNSHLSKLRRSSVSLPDDSNVADNPTFCWHPLTYGIGNAPQPTKSRKHCNSSKIGFGGSPLKQVKNVKNARFPVLLTYFRGNPQNLFLSYGGIWGLWCVPNVTTLGSFFSWPWRQNPLVPPFLLQPISQN